MGPVSNSTALGVFRGSEAVVERLPKLTERLTPDAEAQVTIVERVISVRNPALPPPAALVSTPMTQMVSGEDRGPIHLPCAAERAAVRAYRRSDARETGTLGAVLDIDI